MQIINMTPHPITLHDSVGATHTYPPSGLTVRLQHKSKNLGELDGMPITSNEKVGDNLPDYRKDVYLLVSTLILVAFPDRSDLLAPDTSNSKRNNKGHIVSVPGFIANPRN